jgi:hypothetical protein
MSSGAMERLFAHMIEHGEDVPPRLRDLIDEALDYATAALAASPPKVESEYTEAPDSYELISDLNEIRTRLGRHDGSHQDCASCRVYNHTNAAFGEAIGEPIDTPAPVESGVVEAWRAILAGMQRFGMESTAIDTVDQYFAALATSGEVTEAMIEAGERAYLDHQLDQGEERSVAVAFKAMCAAQVGG